MSLRDTIEDFCEWWLGVLTQTVPSFLKSKPKKTQLELSVKREGLLLTPSADARIQFEPVLIDDVTRLSSFIDAARGGLSDRHANKNITVRLSDNRFIVRQLSPIRLPNSKAKSMALIDMQGATPFSEDEVYILKNEQRIEGANTSYALVKKAIIDPIFQQISDAGYRVSNLQFGADGSGFLPSKEAISNVLPQSRSVVFGQRVFGIAIFAFIIALAFTIGRANWRHYEANTALDQAIELETQNASAVRRLIAQRNESLAQLTTVREEKDGAVPIVVVMEELSKIVPDDTWITDLEINAGVVSISGFSADASKLIPLLEASSYFKEPTFRSPVLRVNVQVGDRFSILMRTNRGEKANG